MTLFDLTNPYEELVTIDMAKQQQQQPQRPIGPAVRAYFCVPEELKRYVPRKLNAPAFLPLTAPLPREGEIVYLAPKSAWQVASVIHHWDSPHAERIEVWIEPVIGRRNDRPDGFPLTQ